MKFLHLSDLHLGKRVGEFNMVEDQAHALKQVLAVADDERPDAVLIAGDVYDKGVPSLEAVRLLDFFLTQLVSRGLPVALISGNHDSPDRLEFLKEILRDRGVLIAGTPALPLQTLTLRDEYGPVEIVLLPFVKPALVRGLFPDDPPATYTDAVARLLTTLTPACCRRVLVAHQFVTAAGHSPLTSESETLSVGGVDNVDASVFDGFDYVALGHIHRPQAMGRDGIRYGGSLLKYSFSEAEQQKGVTVAELGPDGGCRTRLIPLTPLHDMRALRGPLHALLAPDIADAGDREDYLSVTLTDEEELLDPVGSLRAVYPNLMKLQYDNRRTAAEGTDGLTTEELDAQMGITELFREFFLKQNGAPPDEQQERIMEQTAKRTGGDAQ